MGGAHLGGAQMTMNAMSFSRARMTGAHMARARMTDQFRARMAGAHVAIDLLNGRNVDKIIFEFYQTLFYLVKFQETRS